MRYLISSLTLVATAATSHAKCLPQACYTVEFDVQACMLRAVESVDSPDGVILNTGPVAAKVAPCSKGANPLKPTQTSQIEAEREFFYRTKPDDATCADLLGKHVTLFVPDRCCDTGGCLPLPARELIGLAHANDVPEERLTAYVDPSSYKTHPPKYPKSAADQKLAGKLVMRVLVSEKGSPLKVEIAHASPPEAAMIFGDAAKDALLKWDYRPARKDGKPYSSYILVPLTFSPSP